MNKEQIAAKLIEDIARNMRGALVEAEGGDQEGVDLFWSDVQPQLTHFHRLVREILAEAQGEEA